MCKKSKKALITGVTGQDGSYLSEFLLKKNYEVHGIKRRADNNEVVIKVDPKYFRPAEVDRLKGDSSKAFKKLGWSPKITLEEMIAEMIKEDKKEASKEKLLFNKNFKISNHFE